MVDEDRLVAKFSKFGPIRSLNIKMSFAFVEYEDYKDAVECVRKYNSKDVFGFGNILVQQTHFNSAQQRRDVVGGKSRGLASKPNSYYRPKEGGHCFNCKQEGHYSSECPSKDKY